MAKTEKNVLFLVLGDDCHWAENFSEMIAVSMYIMVNSHYKVLNINAISKILSISILLLAGKRNIMH